MRHPNSIDLLTYWNAKRGKRPFPARRDIEPADISKHLPHVLIGEIGEDGTWCFRLAGTGICTLAGGELKGLPVASLWLSEGRRNFSSILKAVQEGAPAVLSLDGLSQGGRVLQAEAAFMPLAGGDPTSGIVCDRIFGSISVFDSPYWVGSDALQGFSTTGFRLFDPSRPNPFLANRPEIAMPGPPAPERPGKFRDFSRKNLILIEGGRKE